MIVKFPCGIALGPSPRAPDIKERDAGRTRGEVRVTLANVVKISRRSKT
jgi:hypothetical protein